MSGVRLSDGGFQVACPFGGSGPVHSELCRSSRISQASLASTYTCLEVSPTQLAARRGTCRRNMAVPEHTKHHGGGAGGPTPLTRGVLKGSSPQCLCAACAHIKRPAPHLLPCAIQLVVDLLGVRCRLQDTIGAVLKKKLDWPEVLYGPRSVPQCQNIVTASGDGDGVLKEALVEEQRNEFVCRAKVPPDVRQERKVERRRYQVTLQEPLHSTHARASHAPPPNHRHPEMGGRSAYNSGHQSITRRVRASSRSLGSEQSAHLLVHR